MSSSQTVQVDALADVELVDNDPEEGAEPPSEAPVVSMPPPLPKRPQRSPVVMGLGFVGVVVVMGGLGALGAHFLVPAAASPTPPVVAPVAAAPPAAAEAPAPEVRHVRLDDEFVIGGPEPDAGTP